MPIKLPELDNKTFDDLMKEMIASIPKYTKEWTNFNPSDPGITVLELLSWITEGLIYRTDRIPDASYINFLRLVAGLGEIYDEKDKAHIKILDFLNEIIRGGQNADIQSMKAAAQEFLGSRYTAVTEEDFRKLALEASPEIVKRVEVFPAQYFVQIILIPGPAEPENFASVIRDVRDYLDKRLLLATVIDVRGAEYRDISLRITLSCKSYANSKIFGKSITFTALDETGGDTVESLAAKEIFTFLDRIKGGPEGKGWQYGRNLMKYELFHIIEKVDGVKNVDEIDTIFPIEVDGLIRLKSLEIAISEIGEL